VQTQDLHQNLDWTKHSLRHDWRVNVDDSGLKVFGQRLHLVFDSPVSPDFDCNLIVIDVSSVEKPLICSRRYLTNVPQAVTIELVSEEVASQKIRRFKGSMMGRTWTVSSEGVVLYNAQCWAEGSYEKVVYNEGLHKIAMEYFE
jgi:hypothetical protein